MSLGIYPKVVDYQPEAIWLYKGQPATPDGCEVDDDMKVVVLCFRLESGVRVRAAIDPDTDTFEDVVYKVQVN